MNFNCGLRTKSMQISVEDYKTVEKPRTGKFSMTKEEAMEMLKKLEEARKKKKESESDD